MRRQNRMLTAIAVWLVVVGASAAFAWLMINRAGRAVMDDNRSIAVLANAATDRPSLSSPPTAPTRPSSVPGVHSPSPATSATPHTSAPVPIPAHPRPTTPVPRATTTVPPATTTRSVTLRGGTVIAACTGSHISLRSATPRNGWRLEPPEVEGGALRVKFEVEGQDESEVSVACVGAIPTFSAP